MMKKLVLFLGCILLMFTMCGCRKLHAMILFNKKPITEYNVKDNEITFAEGEKIHYIFMSDKPIQSGMIRIQVLKREENVDIGGITITYTKDAKIYSKKFYYYTNYVVFYQKGHYTMRVFDRDVPLKEITHAEFWIR